MTDKTQGTIDKKKKTIHIEGFGDAPLSGFNCDPENANVRFHFPQEAFSDNSIPPSKIERKIDGVWVEVKKQ